MKYTFSTGQTCEFIKSGRGAWFIADFKIVVAAAEKLGTDKFALQQHFLGYKDPNSGSYCPECETQGDLYSFCAGMDAILSGRFYLGYGSVHPDEVSSSPINIKPILINVPKI